MNNEELKSELTALLPTAAFEEADGFINMQVEAADWLKLAGELKSNPKLHFDYLFCLTCIDWKTHLMMVYHLSSNIFRHNFVIKVQLSNDFPEVETVSAIWRTAEFHEREVYEMFGVNFLHHPDLRLLILPDGWEGKNPLRKNFEDPINMIKL